MTRMPLATVLLLVVALSLAGCGGGASPAGSAAASPAPPQAAPEPGDAVIRFLECLNAEGGCAESGRMSVTGDGRALTRRDGELVVLQIPVSEVEDMRGRLVKSLARRPGTLDRTRGLSDQPYAVITAVAADGRVHETRLEGGPLVEDEWFVAEQERLSALTGRILATGKVDRKAPIEVSMYEDEDVEPARQATWPAGVPAPAMPSDPRAVAEREYRGEEAAAVRAALGTALDEVAVRVGGRTLIASWRAVLP
ncbi:hypothetical protein FHS43_001630 [Streptosporangium becharense]|uniref:Lipoprotein n=1 Tax=Streptosporangium becharense TaxID=1816182 RepID=A0A7W9ILT0_9ACTN|nr:hypothetical protein [Streptosporangium becharense]MBB2910367.1 hypothetical protein [Streptosporangium becharense]MBB5823110.1 hypothetical protein [Streptosporangium becharense]